MANKIFAQNLKNRRKSKGLSREQLAIKTSLSRHQLQSYEDAKAEPSQENLKRIMEALEITDMHTFLYGEQPIIDPLRKKYEKLIPKIRIAVDLLLGE